MHIQSRCKPHCTPLQRIPLFAEYIRIQKAFPITLTIKVYYTEIIMVHFQLTS